MEQTHIIFHIDVNSAYLSWSALAALSSGSTLDIRSVPAIIGGDIESRHGVVLAKSMPAKKYKIVTGEPIVNALRKYPNLIIEPPDKRLYEKRSSELMHFLYEICPDIEQTSIDECYMDFTPIAYKYESPYVAATLIKDQILEHLGFTVNIGISDKKVLAKMASDFQKPNLVHTLFSYEIQKKMWPLSISSLYMCGKSSVATLHNLEINTIGELAKADQNIISAHLKSHGLLLWEYANGIDNSIVVLEPFKLKGIGNSTTLFKDAITREEAHQTLSVLAETVSTRLRSSGQTAFMISIEIKYNTFQTVSHQKTLVSAINSTQIIYHTACSLFDELWDETPVRLLGIRTSKLVLASDPTQMSLFDLVPTKDSLNLEKQKKLDAAIDTIRQKFGTDAITRGNHLSGENK